MRLCVMSYESGSRRSWGWRQGCNNTNLVHKLEAQNFIFMGAASHMLCDAFQCVKSTTYTKPNWSFQLPTRWEGKHGKNIGIAVSIYKLKQSRSNGACMGSVTFIFLLEAHVLVHACCWQADGGKPAVCVCDACVDAPFLTPDLLRELRDCSVVESVGFDFSMSVLL